MKKLRSLVLSAALALGMVVASPLTASASAAAATQGPFLYVDTITPTGVSVLLGGYNGNGGYYNVWPGTWSAEGVSGFYNWSNTCSKIWRLDPASATTWVWTRIWPAVGEANWYGGIFENNKRFLIQQRFKVGGNCPYSDAPIA